MPAGRHGFAERVLTETRVVYCDSGSGDDPQWGYPLDSGHGHFEQQRQHLQCSQVVETKDQSDYHQEGACRRLVFASVHRLGSPYSISIWKGLVFEIVNIKPLLSDFH